MKEFDYKSLTKDELKLIFSGVRFGIEPMHHQYISMAFAADKNRVAYFLDVGTGKTIAALFTCILWGLKKILVVCPPSAFSAWERDISKYTSFSYDMVVGSRNERLGILSRNLNVCVINYEGLKTVFADFKVIDDSGKKKWIINQGSFRDKWDCVIFDEVHKCSAYDSLQSNICYELSRRSTHVIGLTGTPLDKSMLDLFNVYKVIDLGASLGPNFFAYRNKYFREAWHNWVPKDGCKDKILERLAPVTIAFDRKECFDLPDLQEDVKVITPTQEFLDIQDSIIGGKPIKINGKEYVSEKIDPLDGSCKWDLSSKLRELPGGFLYFKEKDSNVAERLKSNPKLDALLDIIDDSHGKIIVYHSFVEAAGFVEERLRKHKVKFVPVRGGQKPADRQNAIKRFMTDTSVRVMLAHPVCASEGFDGSAANTVLFYDVIGSPRVRDQCVGRIYRKGQTRSCLVLELQLAKSIDSRIAANRKRDVSMVETVMDFLRDRKVNKDG